MAVLSSWLFCRLWLTPCPSLPIQDYSIILVVGSSVECDRPSYQVHALRLPLPRFGARSQPCSPADTLASPFSFQDLVTHTLGKWGYRVLNFAQFVFPFAGECAVPCRLPSICWMRPLNHRPLHPVHPVHPVHPLHPLVNQP